MHSKKKILIIYINRSSFVEQDIEALRSSHTIHEYAFGMNKGIAMIKAQLQLLFFLVKNGKNFNMIYCWFADYHCLIPSFCKSFLKSKIVIAIGGFDAAHYPKYQYGAHLQKLRSYIIKMSIKQADLLVCSSNFVLESLIKTTAVPQLKQKAVTIYPGISCSQSFLNEPVLKKYLLIYVSAGDTINRMKIKGVDRFLDLVAANQEKRFILIGPTGEALRWVESHQLKNLEIIPQLGRSELNSYFAQSTFVALFSRFEAFGMVILEGMCNGCIPIVLKTNGSAEILQFTDAPGFVFDHFNPFEISNFIQNKAHWNISLEQIHLYLHQNFPSDARAIRLRALLN